MHKVAVLVFGLRRHVVQLPDVSLPDAQSEDLDAALPQSGGHRPRVPAVGVAVGDQENDLGGVGAGVTQDLLREGGENVQPLSGEVKMNQIFVTLCPVELQEELRI